MRSEVRFTRKEFRFAGNELRFTGCELNFELRKVRWLNLETNGMCFGCGKANDFGLKLDFEFEGNGLVSRFTPSGRHQGYAGVVHGGILATLADEVMANYLFLRGVPAVTASMNVRYKNPVQVGRTLVIRAEMVAGKGRLVEMASSIAYDEDPNTPLVQAQAKFLKV